jgi:hypothetical protein
MLPSARPRSSSSPQPQKRKSWSPPPTSFRPPQPARRIHTKHSASSLRSFTTISGNSSSDSSSRRAACLRSPNSSETQIFALRTRKAPSRPRSSTSVSSPQFLFTPASTPPLVCPSRSHSCKSSNFPPKKSLSSPLLSSSRPVFPSCYKPYVQDSDDDRDDDEMIFTSWGGSGNNTTTTQTTASLRTRMFGQANGHASIKGGRDKLRSISTTPGLLGAGETETEADEPVSVFPEPFYPSIPPKFIMSVSNSTFYFLFPLFSPTRLVIH